MRKILFLVFNVFAISAIAQDDLPIQFWSDAMVNARDAEHRVAASKIFEEQLDKIIESPEVYNYSYKDIPQLSVISDSLVTFKLVTYQIDKGDYNYKYSGFLVNKSGKVFRLNDDFSNLEDIEYISTNDQDWIGGLYYSMIEKSGKFYLFSYRQLDQYTKFKVFDCLTFEEDGTPVFGTDDFVIPKKDTRDDVKNRVTFQYSADAILSLNYNSAMDMVVHDHLMQVIGRMEGQGPTMVPDGTYEGYVYKDGKWVYEEKLFNHTYDEAPRPKQILGKDNRDIMGNRRKKKN